MIKINNRSVKKLILLVFNILFYCFIDLKSLPILLALIIVTYFCTNKERKNQKFLNALSILFTIGVWLVYKSYIRVLPLGLSFYSFKIISYILDNAKGKIDFEKSFLHYFIYVTYFPEIISGPISRSQNIIKQLDQAFVFQKEKWLKGIQLILSGLFLKFVIANRVAMYVDNVFEDFTSYTGLALLIASFLYSIQIYGDFSGYSNISIGISNLLGIEVERNFNRPYFAKSIKEFWGRWHISLSTWLRDYIYIPLGGNRKGKVRKWLNSMITFLVSGFWHGNGSGYIFWGIYHGILNNFPTTKSKNKFKIFGLQILTFIEATIGWIFFRLESFSQGIEYLKHMFTNFTINYNSIVSSVLPFTKDNASIAIAIVVFIFVLLELFIEIKNKDDSTTQKFSLRITIYIISIILFGIFGVNKFIYMNY